MDEKIGIIKENTNGTPMKIIAYRTSKDIDVEFLDGHHYVKKNTTMSNFNKGNIKNPFDIAIYGIGYVGDGKYIGHEDCVSTSAYRSWQKILERCYNEKYKDKYKSYFMITSICDEWLNYQNFAKWYCENEYEVDERLHVDKDILYPGNKIYSPYHCLLVPQRINMLFTNKKNKRGLPNGIKKNGNKYYAKYNSMELGSANTIEEAYELYAKRKKEEIIKVAEEYKEIIPNKVYEALLNYEVRMENDKNYTQYAKI